MFKKFRSVIFACILFISMVNPFSILAQNTMNVTLTWNESPEMDVTHYIVYWGTESREYTDNSGELGLVTEYSMTLPDSNKVYYFAVTAVDESGLESDYSNEVNTVRPFPPNVKIKVTVEVTVE